MATLGPNSATHQTPLHTTGPSCIQRPVAWQDLRQHQETTMMLGCYNASIPHYSATQRYQEKGYRTLNGIKNARNHASSIQDL